MSKYGTYAERWKTSFYVSRVAIALSFLSCMLVGLGYPKAICLWSCSAPAVLAIIAFVIFVTLPVGEKVEYNRNVRRNPGSRFNLEGATLAVIPLIGTLMFCAAQCVVVLLEINTWFSALN